MPAGRGQGYYCIVRWRSGVVLCPGWESGPLGLVTALLPITHLAAVALGQSGLGSQPRFLCCQASSDWLIGWLVAVLSSALGLGWW